MRKPFNTNKIMCAWQRVEEDLFGSICSSHMTFDGEAYHCNGLVENE